MDKRVRWFKREVVVRSSMNERKRRRVAAKGKMAAISGLCCGEGARNSELKVGGRCHQRGVKVATSLESAEGRGKRCGR
jgi:hypothetical protein